MIMALFMVDGRARSKASSREFNQNQGVQSVLLDRYHFVEIARDSTPGSNTVFDIEFTALARESSIEVEREKEAQRRQW